MLLKCLTALVLIYLLQNCALRKIEGSPVFLTCEIQGAQYMISMKSLRFSSCPGAKV